MKPKECSKYVYRLGKCSYTEVSRGSYLVVDFPAVFDMFFQHSVFNVRFYHHGNEAMAWRDKHNNIVIRIFHADTQTNLNL